MTPGVMEQMQDAEKLFNQESESWEVKSSQMNSLVGNGLHMPSIMLAFILLFQTVGSVCMGSQVRIGTTLEANVLG